MGNLINEAYTVQNSGLLYDASHPADGKIITVTIAKGAAGTIEKGEVIDFDASTGKYSKHAAGKTVSVIAAEKVNYDEKAESAEVMVFTSGAFKKSAVVSDPALTETDIETFRSKGIFLK